MEININEIRDLKFIFKITKIDIEKISFKRYEVKTPKMSLLDSTKSTIEIGELIGEETYYATPELIVEIAGNSGMMFPKFTVELKGTKKKKVIVNKIFKIGE